MSEKVMRKLNDFDVNYIQIIESDLDLNKRFIRSELFANNYYKNKFNKYIDLGLKCELNVDLSQYFEFSSTERRFVCKDCKHKELIESAIVRHMGSHFNAFSLQINSSDRQQVVDQEREEGEVEEEVDEEVEDIRMHSEPDIQMEAKEDTDWKVLDEWYPNEDKHEMVSEVDNNCEEVMSEVSTNCSVAFDQLSSYSDSSQTDSSSEAIERKCEAKEVRKSSESSKSSEFGDKSDAQIHWCDWIGCNKQFNHWKCYQTHRNKHLIDENGLQIAEPIVDFSFGYFSFNGIEGYVKIIEENDCEKYFCKYNSQCTYHSLWSYQLALHIRTVHTCLVPFRCDWDKSCRRIVWSKDMFAHRVSHFDHHLL